MLPLAHRQEHEYGVRWRVLAPMTSSSRRFILLTGAAGRIGSAFRQAHGDRYRFRLADLRIDNLVDTPGTDHEIVQLDITHADACRRACAGVDTVIHLAADPSPEANWEQSLLPNNIRGTVNIFQAALAAGCRRVVFASSVHAVSGYPADETLEDDAAPRPTNLYGASKVFGEAVASSFSARGLSGIAIRIGAYDAPWFHEHGAATDAMAYISARDLNHLLVRCVETEAIHYAVVAGVSNNARNRFDLELTRRRLGYEPEDDGFAVLGIAPSVPAGSRKIDPKTHPLLGRWRIVEMDVWDRDYLDLVEPAYIEFNAQGGGEFAFGALTASLECWYGRRSIEFPWAGSDEGDEVSGHGSAELEDDGTITGEIRFHSGDESAFRARRW
jgi:NAD+ dependent glucose-6-phosphate dehydrogenase